MEGQTSIGLVSYENGPVLGQRFLVVSSVMLQDNLTSSAMCNYF